MNALQGQISAMVAKELDKREMFERRANDKKREKNFGRKQTPRDVVEEGQMKSPSPEKRVDQPGKASIPYPEISHRRPLPPARPPYLKSPPLNTSSPPPPERPPGP